MKVVLIIVDVHGENQEGPFERYWDYSTENTYNKFQCTWWARGRANQYLDFIGKSKISINTGNGCQVVQSLKDDLGFETGNQARPNSIISFSSTPSNSAGHVAYVEAVDKTNGNIYISQAGGRT